jgi:DNA-binding NarL/FixJ family response regulator
LFKPRLNKVYTGIQRPINALHRENGYICGMFTKPASILIIESQSLTNNALNMTLLTEDCGITESSWEDQKIEAAVHLFPDLILFLVGTSNDLEAISSLRKLLPGISIVAFTSGEFHGQEQAAMDHGAHLVVKKAIPRTALVHVIKKMLHEHTPLKLENQWIN